MVKVYKKQGQPDYVFKFPLDENKDYRLVENRWYLMMAWVEANTLTTEHNQQLRLMDWAIDNQYRGQDLIESKLWLAFLWGCCYNLVSPWVILNHFPKPPTSEEEFQRFSDWYNATFEKQRFDTDCRYRKSKMLACVASYIENLNGKTQQEMILSELVKPDGTSFANFTRLWDWCMGIQYYGRLSAWNYVEAVALVTGWELELDAPNFMLTDIQNSDSNRNGMCFIFNREDLLTKHGKLKSGAGMISEADCLVLEYKAEAIFQEARSVLGEIGMINRLNFETHCCWTKKMFRERNTRYLGWDAERTWDEMQFVVEHWPEVSVEPLQDARRHFLPDFWNIERGVNKAKMPVFFLTGKPEHLINFQNGVDWDVGAPLKPKEAKKSVKTTAKKLW